MTNKSIQVGNRVKVVTHDGGGFYRQFAQKEGSVTKIESGVVHVEFDGGQKDFGRPQDVELVVSLTDPLGFKSNRANSAGVAPAPSGTVMDVLFNDGTVILDLPICTGVFKTSVNKPDKSYSATTWRFVGTGYATIVGYRLPKDRGKLAVTAEQLASQPQPAVAFRDLKPGQKARLATRGDGCHDHWGMKVGEVYDVVSERGRMHVATPGGSLSTDYAGWKFYIVQDVSTLDTELAALKAELTKLDAEKEAAEAVVVKAQREIVEAQRVIAEHATKRNALEAKVTKHGLQFIAAPQVVVNAADAHTAGRIVVGTKLKAISSKITSGIEGGDTVTVRRVDKVDQSMTYRVESDSGRVNIWLWNSVLNNYVVV